jgi:hypothetical protein
VAPGASVKIGDGVGPVCATATLEPAIARIAAASKADIKLYFIPLSYQAGFAQNPAAPRGAGRAGGAQAGWSCIASSAARPRSPYGLPSVSAISK